MSICTKKNRWHGWLLRACISVCLAGAVVTSFSGCGNLPNEDRGANQSLVEIGEHSLEQAESLETKGMTADANISYRRALWAFRYHEQLTGEEPFLLDEALEGAERTTPKRR